MAEFKIDAGKQEAVETARKTYEEAYGIACFVLKANNPLRLNVALNYSFFMHEVDSHSDEARKVAHAATEAATIELDAGAEGDSFHLTNLKLFCDGLTQCR